MATAVNVEMIVGLPHSQLRKEDLRHVGVEMLSRVHDDLPESIADRDGSGYGAGLDELRACAENGKDFYDFLPRSTRMLA